MLLISQKIKYTRLAVASQNKTAATIKSLFYQSDKK
nr:MAG TPA: hypothetical protein [Caudoviricetes sp.]